MSSKQHIYKCFREVPSKRPRLGVVRIESRVRHPQTQEYRDEHTVAYASLNSHMFFFSEKAVVYLGRQSQQRRRAQLWDFDPPGTPPSVFERWRNVSEPRGTLHAAGDQPTRRNNFAANGEGIEGKDL